MKNVKVVSLFFALSIFLFSGASFPQTPDAATPPDALIKMVVTDVMASVKADPEIQKGSIPKIVDLVEKKIVPYTDMRRTTQLAMGRNWSKASPEQQTQLIAEFKSLLIRTYSGALSQLRDQTVQYKPFRANSSDTDVIVRTVVIGKSDPIPLDYRLEKTNEGWKVYDINIMGAWLIEAYRNQFTNQISQNGVDGLIKFLQERNAMLAGKK